MYEAILVAATALVSGFTAAVISYLQFRHKTGTEDNRTAIAQYQVILRRMEGQIGRLERQIDDQQKAINRLYEEVVDSQLEVSDHYGWMIRLHDIVIRQNDTIKRMGGDPEKVPELPPRRARKDITAEFLRRTTAQNAALARDVDEKVKEPPHSGSARE